MSNEDLGKIPSVDDSAERNHIETGIQRKKGNKVLTLILVIIACAIIAFTASYYILTFDSNSNDENAQVKKDEALLAANTENNSLAAQMEEIKKQKAEEERLRREQEEEDRKKSEQEEADKAKEQQEEKDIDDHINGNEQDVSQTAAPAEPVDTPEQRRLRGSSLIQLDTINHSSKEAEESDPEGMNNRLAGDIYPKGSAKIVRNRELLLIHGTQIPCALQTRVVTDNPSILICQVTKNIFSADGSTLLIERGSKVFGEQKKALIVGNQMAFVSWSDIDTPSGIRIRIDSLGTDTLGGSGLNVWVDEKWGKRFGGAILLSFIQDALATASQSANKTKVVHENSEENANRMAEIALENSINIQPTGYANQGEQFNILIARDIDFSSVYTLKRGY